MSTAVSVPVENSVRVSRVLVRTLFAPYDDTHGEFLKFVQTAKRSIRMIIFSYTLPDLTDILIEKHKQGLTVEILMDYEQSHNSAADTQVQRLMAAGIKPVVGTSPIIAGAPEAELHSGHTPTDPIGWVLHMKATVVDEEGVEDGSWNYSAAASNECNTVNIVWNKERAAAFLDQFTCLRDWILEHQPQLQPKLKPAPAGGPAEFAADDLAAAVMAPETKEVFHQGKGTAVRNVTLTTTFAPYGKVEDAFLSFLGQAKRSIYLLAYELRTQAIVDLLIAKARAGVEVHVIMDYKACYKDPTAQIQEAPLVEAMRGAGVDVVVGTSPCSGQIMHIKAAVVDQKSVWDGSWNFTPTADFEANSVNVIASAPWARQFLTIFQRIREYNVNHPHAQ